MSGWDLAAWVWKQTCFCWHIQDYPNTLCVCNVFCMKRPHGLFCECRQESAGGCCLWRGRTMLHLFRCWGWGCKFLSHRFCFVHLGLFENWIYPQLMATELGFWWSTRGIGTPRESSWRKFLPLTLCLQWHANIGMLWELWRRTFVFFLAGIRSTLAAIAASRLRLPGCSSWILLLIPQFMDISQQPAMMTPKLQASHQKGPTCYFAVDFSGWICTDSQCRPVQFTAAACCEMSISIPSN